MSPPDAYGLKLDLLKVARAENESARMKLAFALVIEEHPGRHCRPWRRQASRDRQDARPMIALFEIIDHLRAAQVQRLPTDDAIIAGHIDAALAVARVAIADLREEKCFDPR